jgi:hypothetical protein
LKKQADLIPDDRPFTRDELEPYLDGVRRVAVALQSVRRSPEHESGGQWERAAKEVQRGK